MGGFFFERLGLGVWEGKASEDGLVDPWIGGLWCSGEDDCGMDGLHERAWRGMIWQGSG